MSIHMKTFFLAAALSVSAAATVSADGIINQSQITGGAHVVPNSSDWRNASCEERAASLNALCDADYAACSSPWWNPFLCSDLRNACRRMVNDYLTRCIAMN